MAELDYLNINDFTSYPFVEIADFSMSPGTRLPRRGILDAGFIVGIDSGFAVNEHSITLDSFVKGASDVVFTFTSDAPTMSGYSIKFTIPFTNPYGCTIYSTFKIGATPYEKIGSGYIVVGTLDEYEALSNGTYTLTSPPSVEPATIQSLINTYVNEINIANDARPCPDQCGSSSSTASDVYMFTCCLNGDIKLKEGYNAHIRVLEIHNEIEIGAVIGAGAGKTCDDIIIDDNGFVEGKGCVTCDDLIRSINGIVSSTGALTLIGAPGITITPDPVNHKLIVSISSSSVCE